MAWSTGANIMSGSRNLGLLYASSGKSLLNWAECIMWSTWHCNHESVCVCEEGSHRAKLKTENEKIKTK